MIRKRDVGTLRKRGLVWFVRFHVKGERFEESTGTRDEREARAYLAQLRRDLRAGTWTPRSEAGAVRRLDSARAALDAAIASAPSAPVLTLGAYLETWLERRSAGGVRPVRNIRNESASLRAYVVPTLGRLPLASVTRTHLRELVAKLSQATSKRTKAPLAPRSVLAVYRTLGAAFKSAELDGLIAKSPCNLTTLRGELPKKRDKDPLWRSAAVYSREETTALLSGWYTGADGDVAQLPGDRRVFYGLMLLGGLRASEAAGRRWRDYDRDALPLGRLVVATQADGPRASSETKTGKVREVPVHPTLAAMLAEWRLEGFPQLFGRRPTDDDPIVPSRHDPSARSFRTQTWTALSEDLARLKLRRVPALQHSMRSTFLTMLELDGANMAIARRCTHSAPSDVVGGYIRVQWADVCREIAKLQIERRPAFAPVIALPLARAATADSAPLDRGIDRGSGRIHTFSGLEMVGNAGFENAAESGPIGPAPLQNGAILQGTSRDVADDEGAARPSESPQNATLRSPEMQAGHKRGSEAPGASSAALAARVAARLATTTTRRVARALEVLDASALARVLEALDRRTL